MKKLVTIALLCAMLLSCFVGCGSMQAGELDVDAYAADAGAQNVEFRTELSTNADEVDVWDGKADTSWYDKDNPKTAYEISTAEQLRGIYTLQQALPNGSSIFEGVTFTLTKDLDLANRQWSAAASQRYFAGTIDGNGHVIANYWDAATTSGYRSFFGSVTGAACIKNLSLVNGTLYNRMTGSDNKDVSGAVITRANTVSGKKIIISNVYVDVDVVADNPTKTFSKSSGVIGIVQGTGDVLVENVTYVGDIELNGSYASGICSTIEKAKNVTIKNCTVTGNLSSAGSRNGGILGYVQTLTGSLSISGCTVSGSISGTGGTAGILAVTNVTKDISIKNCNVSADITGTTQTAGVLGQMCVNRDEKYKDEAGVSQTKKIYGSAGNVTVSGCTVSGDIVGTTMSGGILGYCDRKITSLKIDNCKMTGSLTANRTSGGIMGTLNIGSGKATIQNCEVTGTLNFTLNDVKNNNAGGMVGKMHSETKIMGCYVAPVMTTTFNPGVSTTATDDVISGAGGLIGRVYDGTTVHIATTEIGGSYTFTHAGDDEVFMFNVGHFIGNAGSDTTPANVIFRDNNKISSDIVFNCTGTADYNVNGVDCRPTTLPIGHQTRDNGNGTYDLRFVFAMEYGTFNGVGATANLRFTDADGIFGEKLENAYATTVYETITDEDGNSYAAADYGYNFLYTLVVKNVPAEINFEEKTLQAVVTSFGATRANGAVTTEDGGVLLVGDTKPVNNVAMGGWTIDYFTPEIPEAFAGENALYIDGHDFDTDLSWGVHTGVKASEKECDDGYADGTLAIPAHVYLDTGYVTNPALMNITYTFEIEEAGYYDMCIYFRMKGSDTVKDSGDGDGSYNRAYLMSIDNAIGGDAIDLHFELDSVKDIKDASAGTYFDLSGLYQYFEAGTHTVTFTANGTSSFPHIRGFYFVQVEG